MKTRALHIWEKLFSSYWFVPTIMASGAMALAFGMLALDRRVFDGDQGPTWFYAGGPEGARSLLSTVASSVITVAGVVFSITIVTLTQASSQFGPRLLRNFMRDTGNQVVLGTFVATFVYCLLVLRTIYGGDDGGRVPQASVTVAVVLALSSLAVLIYFIHHVSMSLQAPHVVAATAAELNTAIAHQFHREAGAEQEGKAEAEQIPEDFERGAWAVPAERDGYLQAIDQETLMAVACRENLILILNYRPGEYVMSGTPLLRAWPPDGWNTKLASELCDQFLIGHYRTPEQDVEFGIDQLVEIAVRALSPGINDPFTAMTCLDWLGAALCRIASRGLPGKYRCDDAGRLRIVARVSTLQGLADAAFNQIRQNGVGKVAVTLRQLEVITKVAEQIRQAEPSSVLLEHAKMVYDQNMKVVQEPKDRGDLEDRYEKVIRAAGQGSARQEAQASGQH